MILDIMINMVTYNDNGYSDWWDDDHDDIRHGSYYINQYTNQLINQLDMAFIQSMK